jgi:hypothetical protein
MDRNGSGWRKMRELYGAGAVAKFTEEERLLAFIDTNLQPTVTSG